jgi:tRNA-dihydrouridine synthase 3
MTKAEKKAKSGQNKGRKFKNLKDEIFMCSLIARGEPCGFGDNCRRSHDLEGYFKNKPKDIRLIHGLEELKPGPPFVVDAPGSSTEPNEDAQTSDVARTLDTSTTCPLFAIFGYCEHGWKCRFLGAHVRPILTSETESSNIGSVVGGYMLVVDEEKKAKALASGDHVELNDVSGAWQKDIRKYPFTNTIPYLREHDPESIEKLPGQHQRASQNKQKVIPTPRPAFLTEDMDEEALANAGEEQATGLAAHVPMSHAKPVSADDEEEALNDKTEPELAQLTGAEVDKDDVPIRAVEKRRLDWRGKTYLAPLTTVGNLVSLARFEPQSISLDVSDAVTFPALPKSLCRLWCGHHLRRDGHGQRHCERS